MSQAIPTSTMSDSVRVPSGVFDRASIEWAFDQWWYADCRYGMVQREAMESFRKWLAEAALRIPAAPAADVTDVKDLRPLADEVAAIVLEHLKPCPGFSFHPVICDESALPALYDFIRKVALPRAADVREAVLVPITDTELRDVLVRALIKNGQQINASFLLSGDKIPVHVTDVYAAMRDIEELTIKSALASRHAIDEARLREILAAECTAANMLMAEPIALVCLAAMRAVAGG